MELAISIDRVFGFETKKAQVAGYTISDNIGPLAQWFRETLLDPDGNVRF